MWICGALLWQYFLAHETNSCVGFLPFSLSKGVFPSRPIMTPGQKAPCMFHQPRQDKRFVTDSLLRAALNVTLDDSDDSTYQHHCVLDEPVRFSVYFQFVLCGDFCFAHFSYTISERNDCRFCVALQCEITVTKLVTPLFRLSTALRLPSSTQRCS